MLCGLFGKLPWKRDFIAIAAPRPFLHLWEPWLADCLVQARADLGDEAWRGAFRAAPIWHFHLRADARGAHHFGAFTPSMDAIGRYFPLTLVAEDEAASCEHPECETCQKWFDAAGDFLLTILDGELSREAIEAGLARLRDFALSGDGAAEPTLADGLGFYDLDQAEAAARPLETIFTAGRSRHATPAFGPNYWWTLGHDAYPPRAFVLHDAMPDARQFSAMLANRRAEAPRATPQP